MDGQTIRTLIQFCIDLVLILQGFSSTVIDFITRPLREITPPFWIGGYGNGPLFTIVGTIIKSTPLGNMTLFSIMLGGGISLYIAVQLWKWLKEIVL